MEIKKTKSMENLGKNGKKTREIYGKPREWRPWVALPKWENQKRKEKNSGK